MASTAFGSRENLSFGKVQDVGMPRKVAQPFENREGKIGRGQLMGEAFADQSSHVGLVVKRVKARDDTARAVAEHQEGQAPVLVILPPWQLPRRL